MTEEEKIKIQEAIDEEIKNSHGHYEEFVGKNCDDCAGWTVGEHRCDCGNRRMTWDYSKNADGTYYVWPCAY